MMQIWWRMVRRDCKLLVLCNVVVSFPLQSLIFIIIFCFPHSGVTRGNGLDLQSSCWKNWHRRGMWFRCCRWSHYTLTRNTGITYPSLSSCRRQDESLVWWKHEPCQHCILAFFLRHQSEWSALLREEEEGEAEIQEVQGESSSSFPGYQHSNGRADAPTLLEACRNGCQVSTCRMLLEQGMDVNHEDMNGGTPLLFASQRCEVGVCRMLLDAGAKVNHKDLGGGTALLYSCKRGSLEVCRLLLQRNADMEYAESGGDTPLLAAVQIQRHDLCQLLLENGVDVNRCEAYGTTPLMQACSCSDIGICKLLVEQGAHVNATTANGLTALMYASMQGNLEIMQYLLDHDGWVYVREALPHALPHPNACRLLLANGANVHQTPILGRTPLGLASSKGFLDTCHVLLDAGADVDAVDFSGATPLMHAVVNGHESIVRLLLERGAHANARTNVASSALALAYSHWSSADVAQLLIDYGADVNSALDDGDGPLFKAISSCQLEACEHVLLNGANVDAVNSAGWSPLEFAVARFCGQPILLCLLKFGAEPIVEKDIESLIFQLPSELRAAAWDMRKKARSETQFEDDFRALIRQQVFVPSAAPRTNRLSFVAVSRQMISCAEWISSSRNTNRLILRNLFLHLPLEMVRCVLMLKGYGAEKLLSERAVSHLFSSFWHVLSLESWPRPRDNQGKCAWTNTQEKFKITLLVSINRKRILCDSVCGDW